MGFPEDDRYQVINECERVVESLARNPGIDPGNVMITITENRDIDG